MSSKDPNDLDALREALDECLQPFCLGISQSEITVTSNGSTAQTFRIVLDTHHVDGCGPSSPPVPP